MPLDPKQQPPYYTPATGSASQTKTYRALITQVGTAAPTANILSNTLTGTPAWTRDTTGSYLLTLATAFPATKTAMLVQNNNDGGLGIFYIQIGTSPNIISLQTADFTFSLQDDLLINTYVQIDVYP